MKSDLMKKGTLRVAYLISMILCTIVFMKIPMKVQAAEEDGVTQLSSAKIYSSMSESSDVIANLIVGNVFEVLGAENDSSGGIWYRVRTDFGAEGYVKAGEMDKLITDAQAILSQVTTDTGEEEPMPAGDNVGEEPAPEEGNAGEEPVPEEDNAGEEPVPEEDNAGEEPAPEEGNAGEEPAPEENPIGEDLVPAEDMMGEEPISETISPLESENVSEPDFVYGAGAGKMIDNQSTDNTTIGSEEFTVIERTDNAKVHRHSRIDVVLIMIIAGGILCIIVIAALLKRMMKCVGTEA